MEAMLQPAYTAATYFLFQDAIVRDPKARKPWAAFDNKTTTLDFASTSIRSQYGCRSPTAWLTFAGCIVLGASLGPVLFLSVFKRQSIREINEPHLMVRVMFDEKPFPLHRLHRRVVRDEQEKRQFDVLGVRGLSLKPEEGEAAKHR